ncbi:MAG: ABC transporter substrate-binding protein [Finegoldia sp.]|nr:ABC transporter substrate-binding protein [Finegoldia sp.]
MRKKLVKFFSFFVFILSAGFVLSSCGQSQENAGQKAEDTTSQGEESKETSSGEPKDGGVFVRAIGKDPATFNPNAVSDNITYLISQNIYNKLLKINGEDKIVPDLAESYEVSEDGKVITFKLKKAKWHDGEDLTADDVKWTFDTIKAKEGFAAPSLADIQEVKVVDDSTVEFHLSAPNAGILGAIAWQGTYIMPSHLYKDSEDWLEADASKNPVGSGPFKFVEYKPGESITLEKNADFFGQTPHLDQIKMVVMPDQDTTYQAWLAGEIDGGAGIPEEEFKNFENNPDYQKVKLSWPNKSYFCFNMEKGKFADPKVREAVLYGINIDEIFEKGLKSVGEKQKYFIPWQYDWAINESIQSPERDVEKAKKLLEEAGYTQDENGFYFETTIDTFPGWDEIMPIFQSQFAEFGIKLNHNSMDDPTYDQKVLEKKDFELTVLGGYMGPDISSLSNRFGTGGFINYGLYSSEEMDALLEEGIRTTDPEKRAQPYKKIQELLRKDLPAVFFSDKYGTDYVKSYLKGFPASDEAKEFCSEAEYTYLWLDK